MYNILNISIILYIRRQNMSLYEGISCPVCKNEFVDGDDIVVCPECGTPHHRECYNMIGHCVNQGLHQSGYSFQDEINKNKPQKTEANVVAQEKPKSEEKAQQMPPFVPVAVENEDNEEFKNDSTEIDGFKVQDIANVVRVKAHHFVPIFNSLSQKKTKASWNGSGFIFGSFYLLYRKMYKQGIAFFALCLSVLYASNALIFKYAPAFTGAIVDLSRSSMSGINPTQEQMKAIMNAGDIKTAMLITYGAIGVIALLHLIIGIFANAIYKKSVEGIIKKVDAQLNDDATTGMPTIISIDSNMPKEQIRRIYLARRGGVSFFAPAIAVMIFSLIM